MEIKELQSKKGLLDKMFYKVNNQRDFFVAGTYKDEEGNIKFSKWKTYLNSVSNIDVTDNDINKWKEKDYFESIDQRQILPNEIVLDLEDPAQLKPILEKLKGWNFSVWKTGSRGYHIHILFNRDMTTIEKENVIKKLDTDVQKCSEKCLIALENCPHWKTGNKKTEVKHE